MTTRLQRILPLFDVRIVPLLRVRRPVQVPAQMDTQVIAQAPALKPMEYVSPKKKPGGPRIKPSPSARPATNKSSNKAQRKQQRKKDITEELKRRELDRLHQESAHAEKERINIARQAVTQLRESAQREEEQKAADRKALEEFERLEVVHKEQARNRHKLLMATLEQARDRAQKEVQEQDPNKENEWSCLDEQEQTLKANEQAKLTAENQMRERSKARLDEYLAKRNPTKQRIGILERVLHRA